MDLLSVRLLLWKGNRQSKIPTCKRPDALLLLQSLHTGCCIYAEGGEELKRYQQRMQQFPISLPRGAWKQLDAEYEELQWDVVRPPLRERPANSWITTEMWKLVNHRAMLGRKGMLSQTASHGLSQQVQARLVVDCRKRTSNTASQIKGCLAAGNFVEAWCNLKRWY
jgi:hypothetical protein